MLLLEGLKQCSAYKCIFAEQLGSNGSSSCLFTGSSQSQVFLNLHSFFIPYVGQLGSSDLTVVFLTPKRWIILCLAVTAKCFLKSLIFILQEGQLGSEGSNSCFLTPKDGSFLISAVTAKCFLNLQPSFSILDSWG